MRCSAGSSRTLVTGALLVLVFVSLLPAPLQAEDQKGGIKQMGRDLGKFGRKVGDAGKEAGLEIAGAAKSVFYKGKRASAPLLRDVQRSTREFWAKVIAGKDRTIERLRKENAELKRQLGDDGEDGH
jgi:hypothetical protein